MLSYSRKFKAAIAELGYVIETHLKSIGLLHDPDMSPEQRALIAEKRAAYESRLKKNSVVSKDTHDSSSLSFDELRTGRASPAQGPGSSAFSSDMAGSGAETARRDAADSIETPGAFPPGATMCGKCNTNAVIMMDGCATCLSCGYSKCG